MFKEKPVNNTMPGPQQSLRTIAKFDQRTQDQSSDLGKAINVFKPANVKNPFLGQSKQGQSTNSQSPPCESIEQKK